MNQKQIAQGLLYSGVFTALASVFAELQQAQTWADVLTPSHIFGALGAFVMAAGAFLHPSPGSSNQQ